MMRNNTCAFQVRDALHRLADKERLMEERLAALAAERHVLRHRLTNHSQRAITEVHQTHQTHQTRNAR